MNNGRLYSVLWVAVAVLVSVNIWFSSWELMEWPFPVVLLSFHWHLGFCTIGVMTMWKSKDAIQGMKFLIVEAICLSLILSSHTYIINKK